MTHEPLPPGHPNEQPAEHDARESDGPVVEEHNVKQGRKGFRILWVLIISMVLIVAIFAVIYAVRAPGLSETEAETNAMPMPAEMQPAQPATTTPAAEFQPQG
tara:strand:+ start:96 stop:404 length:309 start_codon:yes stop_codon:yes gene_type:complete